MNPTRDGEMIQSMIEHSEQNVQKMLPVWSFQGNETWCMIGYHSVSVISDAYLKNIKNFDVNKAFTAMKNTANNENYGGIKYYKEYGYVPIDKEAEGASKTLEYAYDDWTIAQMAKKLGNKEVAESYYKRARNYKNVFDPKTGFIRAKKSDGTFREPFDPLYAKYSGDYTEGNAWQYSWYVPQDVQGLIELHGGDDSFCQLIDSLFVIETDDEKYKEVEDIAGLIGQYAHGNEPSQHIAYLYNYAGKPWKTQEKIHLIMNHLFDNTPDGICGNEDCGQMSAWYIFSSLGFYPVCPGSNEYIFGTPSVEKAVISLENGKQFTVIANNLSDENLYIKSVSLNGKEINRSFILHDEIMKGGTLVYEMSAKPYKDWATSKESRPYSFSK
jgi:predicted alpha-1,2-mannosidase